MQHIFGERRGGGQCLTAVPLASPCQQQLFSPWSPSLRSAPPKHLPQSVTLRVWGELEIPLLPLTGLEGPVPCQGALQAHLFPHPSLERTRPEDQCPALGGGCSIPISTFVTSLMLRGSRAPPPLLSVLQKGPLAVVTGLRCPG